MTILERACAITASDDCERLISKYCYYYGSGMNREIFFRLFSGREDISLTINNKKIDGRDNFFQAFVLDQEQRAFDYHKQLKAIYPVISTKMKDHRRALGFTKPLMSNMVLEIAEDGQSAKGLWYTMGYEYTTLTLEQKKRVRWFLQRHAADFVLEDGQWKILNLYAYTDAEGAADAYQWPVAEQANAAGEYHNKYSATQVPQNSPAIPEPYQSL